MAITIEARLRAGIKFDKDAQVFVTYAPALGIYSQAETAIRAKAALEDAIDSFFRVAIKNDVLERCLRAAGLTVASSAVERTCAESEEYIKVMEARILEENQFTDIFDVPRSISFAVA